MPKFCCGCEGNRRRRFVRPLYESHTEEQNTRHELLEREEVGLVLGRVVIQCVQNRTQLELQNLHHQQQLPLHHHHCHHHLHLHLHLGSGAEILKMRFTSIISTLTSVTSARFLFLHSLSFHHFDFIAVHMFACALLYLTSSSSAVCRLSSVICRLSSYNLFDGIILEGLFFFFSSLKIYCV